MSKTPKAPKIEHITVRIRRTSKDLLDLSHMEYEHALGRRVSFADYMAQVALAASEMKPDKTGKLR
ncbi:MAG: hypothetical protein WCZ10_14545 [Desulfobulbaceae bacterium]